MSRIHASLVAILFAAAAVFSHVAVAADSKWTVETIASDLAEPTGLAVQPEKEDIFVSESGAGRILAFTAAKPNERRVVVEGFPRSEKSSSGDPAKRGGLAGLGFLNDQLLVAAFDRPNQKPAIGLFTLPAADEKDAKPLTLDSAKQTLSPVAEEKPEQDSSSAAGHFFGVTVSQFSPSGVIVTNPGSARGWLFRADIRNRTTLDDLRPLLASKATPLAITVNRRGVLVVATTAAMGKDPSENSLAFYNTKTGGLIASMPAPLSDIVGLAYSPESGRLYAASFSRAKPAEAGIYRLDSAMIDNRADMKAVRIATIDRPTALAFSVDNTLYATSFGGAQADAKKSASTKGSLIRITGDL